MAGVDREWGPGISQGVQSYLFIYFENIFKVQKSSKYQNVPTTQN